MRIILFISLLIFPFLVKSQYYTINDPVFVTWLTTEYPTCMNGNQMDTTCPGIITETNIYLHGYAGYTNLDGLRFFDNLDTLDIGMMQLSSLPVLPPYLEILYCADLGLTSLPALPNSLRRLGCEGNQLTSLPSLPDSLRLLGCDNNSITALPAIPPKVFSLSCNNNLLTSLPALPDSLIHFHCSSNQISVLPQLPSGLQTLICTFNQLTDLPLIPENINEFSCYSNNISSLPHFPVNMSGFDCAFNQINCFENLPNVSGYVDISNNPFTCVPNLTSYTLGYPLCEFNDPVINPDNCSSLSGIHGTVYKDEVDCLSNGNELQTLHLPVKLYDSNANYLALSYTNGDGEYFFPCNNNDYLVKIDSSALGILNACDFDLTATVTNSITHNVNFFLKCNGNIDLKINGIVPSGLIFPGQNHQLDVFTGFSDIHNELNCLQSVSGRLKIIPDGPVSYVSAFGASIPTQVIGDTLIYEIADFSAINFNDPFSIILSVDTTAVSGDLVCALAYIEVDGNDIFTSNDSLYWCYEVVNSYDPNHKGVTPSEVYAGYDDYLTYLVQFQNTGNAPAINIKIEDTLSVHLNPETFELLNSSHDVIPTLVGNRLQFRFNNIYLDDSTTNEPESHGFVQFRVKPYSGILENDSITNKVSIYFDYNPPVVTNTAVTKYVVDVSGIAATKNETVTVYPNPSNSVFHVKLHSGNHDVVVYNLEGKEIMKREISGTHFLIDLAKEQDGIYLLKIVSGNQTSFIRLIKL